ncbi:MAG: DUF692 domain-containing protein [Planctomycetes bacterium]|nr:DUF692 domain-containing protein [Planctomycetota bacterium]
MPRNSVVNLPFLGFGLGLRSRHYVDILDKWPDVDFFEIVSDNFMDTEGRPMDVLERVAEHYPIILHGVSMSIGSVDPLDAAYLKRLKRLADRLNSPWVSDHVCWSSEGNVQLHDLLPLPYDEPTLRYLIKRARSVQKALDRPLILENPSTYLQFTFSTMPEWEFIARLLEEADCGMLLDVNNVYVSSENHGFDPFAYIDAIPRDRVVYFHLAGHTRFETHILDTHSDHVVDGVWKLYTHAQRRFGGRSTILEWDEDIPDFKIVHAELNKAKTALRRAGIAMPGKSLITKPAAKPARAHAR